MTSFSPKTKIYHSWSRFPFIEFQLTIALTLLAALIPIAVLAAIFPVHPLDLIYNVGVRRFTGTPRLPKRGVPSRFACGLGAVWVATTAWAFSAGHLMVGYVLGGALTATATLVSTTDICIPSLIYRGIFGQPKKR